MWTVVLAGVAFGIIMQRSRVNTFDRIGGFAMLEDFTVPKLMMVAIAVSGVLLFVQVQAGGAEYHIKPFVTVGIIAGGILFGAGMALLGYCPGTLFVSAGEGALDAWLGLAASVVAGGFYVVLFPLIRNGLGPDLGKLQIHLDPVGGEILLLVAYAALLVAGAVFLDRRDRRDELGRQARQEERRQGR